ncbi:unnamed protein product [Rotaria sp. Silwood2]|nr:unnamed protein product [Rotaria sp. Silwood2]CAF3311350.1 unnamed protein product [Rotaria sp. Silwood2]CAF4393631.1 unnamed protein product [Rotaria sp. Silwood2]CAF4426501.1 unnamed protein product [Rotaria sp. Silwood2]
MSVDSDRRQSSFRFRDKFSHYKDRVKEKIKDKTIKHNITLIAHQNLTSDDTIDHYDHTTRHGFRQQMHHMKDVFKNKTHYSEIKDKIKGKIDDKLDLHGNKTYPKGFYDSLFSPETENDVYLQTALICLWVIALLCIIPTIIVILLPAKKKKATTTSTNMIFFHIFLCEIFYLSYVLLAMINVAKEFRLGPFLCDFANYGMYVTIPIMQFALLFLSLERLQKHFNLSLTWAKIFTKPYLIQVILCAIWIILVALVATFMFIKKQFSFNFLKDKVNSLAPPLFGDVVSRMVARRHHCSVDGRLSSVFKTAIIILFIILIVKPILFSLGFNLLTPYCCKKRRKDLQRQGDRRITTLVTIFLLLNLIFSFPFYFVSMFNNILTRIDSTKDTFTIILKICFILRITNIIFECLAFYIFERNSWNLFRKLLYYGTCKKFPIFNKLSDDDVMYTKDPDVQDLINQTRLASDDDDDQKIKKKQINKKRRIKKEPEPITESEPDDDNDDDDGAFRKSNRHKSQFEKAKTPDQSDNDDDDENKKTIVKRKPNSSKKTNESDEDEEDIPKNKIITRQMSSTKKIESDNDEDVNDEPKKITGKKRKSTTKRQESDNDEDEENEPKHITTTKRSSRTKKSPSDDDDDDKDDENEKQNITTTKRSSRTKKSPSDDDKDEEHQTTMIPKRKSRRTIQEETIIEHPKPKSTKAHRKDDEIRIPNGRPTSHRPSSVTDTYKTKKPVQRQSTSTHNHTTKHHSRQRSPSSNESEADTDSNASHTSSKMIKTSTPPKPITKQTTKTYSSLKEQHKRIRTRSPNEPRSRYRTESSPSSQHRSKQTKSTKSHQTTKKHSHSPSTKTNTHTKKPKKDHHTRILEMSDEV